MVATDGRIWNRCALKNALEQNTLNVPTPTILSGRNVPVQYVYTSDNVFPLYTYMMKPHPQSNITVKKQIFSYRLSRVRHIFQKGFGILANRCVYFKDHPC